jgi:hypothetical protein
MFSIAMAFRNACCAVSGMDAAFLAMGCAPIQGA